MQTDRAERNRRALKPRDFWWTVLVIDPIVMAVLPVVVRWRWATPTRISLAALLVGAGSIVAFATGQPVVGALAFQARFALDCLDGKVARLTGRSSRWGGFVDLAGDMITIGAVYAAIGAWVGREGVAGAWMVLVLLPAFTAAIWLHQYERGVIAGLPPDERPTPPSVPPSDRIWTLRRFERHPGSVEVETLLLLVYPLLLPIDWYPWVAGAATAFYLASGAQVVVELRKLLRT